MLETAQVTSTVLKFPISAPSTTPTATVTGATSSTTSSRSSSSSGSPPVPNKPRETTLSLWENSGNDRQRPDSLTSLIKVEPTPIKIEQIKSEPLETGSDSTVSVQPAPPGDFAELKPIPFDYTSTEPSQANNNNNNNHPKTMPDVTSPNSSRPSSSSFQYNSSSHSDVTSSGSSSPPGITKLETLDFTASQDAFDDLASIVGISMGADSTVPNMDGDMDLDAWIENTAQNIKPLVGDNSLETIIPGSHGHGHHHHPHHAHHAHRITLNGSQQYLPMGPAGSTLQSLLQGTLTPGPPPPGSKMQLQHRDGLPPPPYSILQNRLQHGNGAGGAGTPLHISSNNVVKVDSTFDLMKMAAENNNNNNNNNNSYLSAAAAAAVAAANAASSYADSTMPHSTQTPLNHVSTSDQSLHRRLGELGGLAKMKAKQNKMRQKLGMAGGGGGPVGGAGGVAGGPNGDQGKKMMHHCQICNRGFLNKSNIKVHLRTHTGEKPFKCEHCSKAFRQKAHLLKHMSIHKRISRD